MIHTRKAGFQTCKRPCSLLNTLKVLTSRLGQSAGCSVLQTDLATVTIPTDVAHPHCFSAYILLGGYPHQAVKQVQCASASNCTSLAL